MTLHIHTHTRTYSYAAYPSLYPIYAIAPPPFFEDYEKPSRRHCKKGNYPPSALPPHTHIQNRKKKVSARFIARDDETTPSFCPERGGKREPLSRKLLPRESGSQQLFGRRQRRQRTTLNSLTLSLSLSVLPSRWKRHKNYKVAREENFSYIYIYGIYV